MSKESDAMTAWRILADMPKCASDGACNHHPRGLAQYGVRLTRPGTYCRCCARIWKQAMFETDAYDCNGNEIDSESILTLRKNGKYVLKGEPS